MAGRNIFTGVQQLPGASSSSNTSSSIVTTTTPGVSREETATDLVVARTNDTDLQISWLGTFDPADTGLWADSGLLLVFGGIPWQVGGAREFTV